MLKTIARTCIQVTSDLHLEMYHNTINYTKWLTPSAPYLAIVGDLGYPSNPNFKEFLHQTSKVYDQVFFVVITNTISTSDHLVQSKV
jgi:hypothetical protein